MYSKNDILISNHKLNTYTFTKLYITYNIQFIYLLFINNILN